MKLVTDAVEVERVASLLPSRLRENGFEWRDIDRLAYDKKSDLFYFDVIDESSLCRLPAMLRHLAEERCFIWNYRSLHTKPRGRDPLAVIEVLSNDDESLISRNLRDGADQQASFLAVYHLTGLFGIVPESTDWLILAEPDEHAVLLAKHEIKFAKFQSLWWPQVSERLTKLGWRT
ncbi:MAG: hypothetical protein Q8M26_06565 [Pseudolabrys sp.]|nr:hypothetical protein [Pseudolabrys sp.]